MQPQTSYVPTELERLFRLSFGNALIFLGATLPYIVFLLFARIGFYILGQSVDGGFIGFWLLIIIGFNLYRWAKPWSRGRKTTGVLFFFWNTFTYLLIMAIITTAEVQVVPAFGLVFVVWYVLWLRWHGKLTIITNK